MGDVLQVACGDPGACALTSDGIVYCWGGAGPFYDTSLLGRGDVDSGAFDPNPASVVMPPGVIFKRLVAHSYGFCAWVPTQVTSVSEIVQIASGGAAMHVCTLDRNGSVKCWGYDMSDQLGTAVEDGGAASSLVPLDVAFP